MTPEQTDNVVTIARGLIEYTYGPATWRQILAEARNRAFDYQWFSAADMPPRRVPAWTGPPIRRQARILVGDAWITPERYAWLLAEVQKLHAEFVR